MLVARTGSALPRWKDRALEPSLLVYGTGLIFVAFGSFGVAALVGSLVSTSFLGGLVLPPFSAYLGLFDGHVACMVFSQSCT